MTAGDRRGHPAATLEALGAISAQKVVDGLRAGSIAPLDAWIALGEIVYCYGSSSPAVRAFMLEVAKRVAETGR